MAGVRLPSGESAERRKTAAFIFGVSSLGFFVLGLAALLFGAHYRGSFAGYELVELVVSGVVAFAVGIFLIVGMIAAWLDKAWLGEWND